MSVSLALRLNVVLALLVAAFLVLATFTGGTTVTAPGHHAAGGVTPAKAIGGSYCC